MRNFSAHDDTSAAVSLVMNLLLSKHLKLSSTISYINDLRNGEVWYETKVNTAQRIRTVLLSH